MEIYSHMLLIAQVCSFFITLSRSIPEDFPDNGRKMTADAELLCTIIVSQLEI